MEQYTRFFITMKCSNYVWGLEMVTCDTRRWNQMIRHQKGTFGKKKKVRTALSQ